MGEKTRVHITSFNGQELNFDCDTTIVFTFDNPSEITDGEKTGLGVNANCAFVGDDFDELHFTRILANVISVFVENRNKSNNVTPAMSALHLHEIASSLEKHSESIIENLSGDESAKALSDLVSETIKSIFR